MIATPPRPGARFTASAIALVMTACAPPGSAEDPDLVPPILGQDAIEAWFDAGHHLSWTCEPAAHDALAPSPHGRVRLCANAIATSGPVGSAAGVARPAARVAGPAAGAAGVDAIDATVVLEVVDATGAIVGRGAQRHTGAGLDAASWYWYMRVPADSETVHDAGGLAADGWGFEGPPATYCGGCHAAAGAHQPGHDYVFVVPGVTAVRGAPGEP